MKSRPWTTTEIAKLKELAGTMPTKDVANALGRSTTATMVKASQVGASLAYTFVSVPWLASEVAIIVWGLQAGDTPDQICERIPRHTKTAVRQRCLTEARARKIAYWTRSCQKALRPDDIELIKNVYPFMRAKEIKLVLESRGREVDVQRIFQAAQRLGLSEKRVKSQSR